MSKGRVEAFSDGVIAILITIMVLELRVPPGGDLAALRELSPIFLSYVLSFVFLGIYWNNHHHLWHAVKQVNGRVLWANLHLLFWLSLIPFATGWMGENHFARLPVILYGVILWMTALAYYMLVQALTSLHGTDSLLSTALGRKRKEIGSLILYSAAIAFAFISTAISLGLYTLVALIWFVPDLRIERTMRG